MCEYNVIVSVKEVGNIFKFNCSSGKCSVILRRLFTSPKINSGCTSPKLNLGCTSPKINLGCTSPKLNLGYTSPKINLGCTRPKNTYHICCMARSLRSLRQVATLRHGHMARRSASLRSCI